MVCQETNKASPNTVTTQSCSCGRGGAKDKERSFCSNYGSRCKCFQALQGCNPSCKCCNCGNPYGTKNATAKENQTRKRGKHDDVTLSSLEYLERKNEPLAPERLGDFEVFVLQQLVNGILMESQENATPDYQNIFEFFKQVITTAGFTNIPSYEKVKNWTDNIIREKKLFSLMLQNEVEISFK